MNDHYNMSKVAITGVVDSNGDYKVVKIKNADKIREMSDEQFAHWLVERVIDSPWCKPDAPIDKETYKCQIWDCERCALEWLKQKATDAQ